MIISILSPKGGAGKTTVCTNLARAYQLGGHSVLIVDSDPQGTSADWLEQQDENTEQPAVATISNARTMQRDIQTIAKAYDFVFVDGAAKMIKELQAAAVSISDLVIIPCRPSAADIWGSAPILEDILARQQITNGKQPKAAFLINARIAGTVLDSQISEALEGYGVDVMATRLTNRVAYAEALAAGETVLDFEPDGKAAEEIKALVGEIQKRYG